MFRLAILVTHGLVLMAPVALDAALEVVVLALAADPTTIREIKVLLRRGTSRVRSRALAV